MVYSEKRMPRTRATLKISASFLAWVAVAIGVFALAYLLLPNYTSVSYSDAGDLARSVLTGTSTSEVEKEASPSVPHVETPEKVRAVYITSWVAGTPSMREPIIELVNETELNSVVIDIKDDTGRVSFATDDPTITEVGSVDNRIKDLRAWLKELHTQDIYVIGRIASFQDPYITGVWKDHAVKTKQNGPIWKNRKGTTWIDPGSKKAWEYLAAIGKASYDAGFDEIQYDYIRFPSDGDTRNTYYPVSNGRTKQVVIEEFFRFIHDEFADHPATLSADLFGMTTTNTDDLQIGQVLERALPYFDYISPMVYPSHYPPGFHGMSKPAEHPYRVIKYAMDRAVARTVATSTPVQHISGERLNPAATSTPPIYSKEVYDKDKIRPWLQDFSLQTEYDASMVRDQIRATYDAGLDSWMLWDARNTYTREALKDTN